MVSETLKALQKVLGEARQSRSEAVAIFKQAEQDVARYEHVRYYSELNKLPKNKLQMHREMCKLREQLQQSRANLEKQQELTRVDRKQLKSRNEELEKIFAGLKGENDSLHEKINKLKEKTLLQAKKLKEKDNLHQEELKKERRLRVELEDDLEQKLQDQKARFDAEMERLKDEKDALEIQVDRLSGEVTEGKLSLLEERFGF